MKAFYGIPKRYLDKLEKMTSVGKVEKPETVAEYIKRTGVKTERRISKRGTELIKVFYLSGTVKEYPVQHIDNTNAMEV